MWCPQDRYKLLIIWVIRVDLELVYHDISTLGWVSINKHFDWGGTLAALTIRHDNGKFLSFRWCLDRKQRHGVTANLDC